MISILLITLMLNCTVSGNGTIDQFITDGDNVSIISMSGVNSVQVNHSVILDPFQVPRGFGTINKRNDASWEIKRRL
jgi:hypothetical protein